jgi:hypothetical protein
MKADWKKNNKETDIGFLSAVKKMQLEDDYDMLDSHNDVLSLDDEEEISITSVDVRRVPVEQVIVLVLVSLIAMNQNKKLVNVLLPQLNYYVQRKGLKLKNYQQLQSHI